MSEGHSPGLGPLFLSSFLWYDKPVYFLKEGFIMESTEKVGEKRLKVKKLHIEFLRALCIWLVMFTHTSTAGFSLYIARPASLFYPLYLAVPFWVKTAVPIFFMISGALLLGREEPLSQIWKKRIWRFLQVIFIFSLINYVWFYHNLPLTIPGHIAKFFTMLYTSDLATAYYFLYIYISFLLMLPIWRKLVKVMGENLYLYLIGLNLFFVGCIPVISFLIFKGTAEMNYFLNPLLAVSEPTFYFLMGYWIENVLPMSWLTKKNLVKLGCLAILGTAIAGGMTWYHGVVAGGMTEAISERFYDCFLFLNTSFIFCTCRWWFAHHRVSESARKVLIFLGSMSFGVMLFEEITRNLTHIIYTHVLLKYLYRIPFIDAVIWICIAYCLGIIITWLLKKIPYFDRLI